MITSARDLRVLIAMLALSLGACTGVGEEAGEQVDDREFSVRELNGNTLNGNTLNGNTLNGNTLNGNTLNGNTLNGNTLNGVTLQGSSITAVASDGTVLSGSQLIGAKFTGQLIDGSAVTLRIDDVEVETTKHPADPIHLYKVAFQRQGDKKWNYVCGVENKTPVKTIPLAGRWNHDEGVPGGGSRTDEPGTITFACSGYALYKCVELGYQPWVTYGGRELSDYHQACTRMIRADYCGDGQSWTVDGTLINVYDNISLQSDTETWPQEAEWTVDGARCLSHQRIQDLPTMPTCSFERPAQKCANPPQWSKTLLVTEAL
jgi:hypothetical protein